ncbi:hypothetical protein APR50_10660 [Variovorax paradoxus]|jgi:hypothetical protein|uniref:hypothetical protein n=1 Tax=Variovorax paradoxus TaxID=34073 RepID=UPI0006E69928|nr:hypothetical protein APR52_20895 [Variovorax paradoxus]KPV08923.1 hypothetical protein APR50_10660 [Variovorax paradoxus]KPV11420.1 hypothetical protein APR49_09535 [Variovorax paradoxus]KPV23309.1 hypothetical protein APR51_08095 [Variovorax paradoxus]KPV31123.1 hypothetical protein APR48_17500 [Variovorax paradoxus]
MARIEFSALGPTLAEQCEQQGLYALDLPIDMADKLAHAVTLCHLRGVLTDTEANRARARILKLMNLRQVRAALQASAAKTGEV